MATRHRRALLLILSVFFLGSCQTTPDYHLIYPNAVPDGVTTWQQEIIQDGLLMNFSWARPAGAGPFATVMVHPHGGKTVKEMEGVIWDLAQQGYLAVAVDYKRLLDGEFKRNTFVWKTDADSTRALNIISQSEWVDPERIAALGFSQGAMSPPMHPVNLKPWSLIIPLPISLTGLRNHAVSWKESCFVLFVPIFTMSLV